MILLVSCSRNKYLHIAYGFKLAPTHNKLPINKYTMVTNHHTTQHNTTQHSGIPQYFSHLHRCKARHLKQVTNTVGATQTAS
jgi:hypothetical protein